MTRSTDAATKFEPTKPDDGGPAFPSVGGPEYVKDAGMSLRDWFAGQALAGLGTWNPGMYPDLQAKADFAYATADAMLKARGR